VDRRGRRRYILNTEYTYRPADNGGWNGLRDIQTETNADVFTTLDHEIESADLELPQVIFQTEAEDYFGGTFSYNHENLFDTFEIVDDVVIPVGQYDSMGGRLFAGGARSRPIGLKGALGYSQFFTGERLDYEGSLILNLSSRFYTELEYEENHIDLAEGDFIVRILRTRVNLTFSPDLSWNTSVQYDNQSEKTGVQSRIRWEFDPGQELFIVYSDTLNTDDGTFTSIQRELNIKLGMTFRF
jgi:hypothetical protein